MSIGRARHQSIVRFAHISPSGREAIVAYVFALPWLLNLLLFNAYPIAAAVYYSFTQYDILQPARWIGLGNYSTMFASDERFWKALYNTVYYAAFSVPLDLVVSLL